MKVEKFINGAFEMLLFKKIDSHYSRKSRIALGVLGWINIIVILANIYSLIQ